LALLAAVAWLAPAWAQPSLSRLLPEKGPVGSTVFLTGTGFGSDRSRVKVLFSGVEGKLLAVRDTSLAVTVPEGAPARSLVLVEVDGQRSNALPFEVASGGPPAVKVRLEVGKNPLGVGEETTGVFTVENSQEPVRIHFVNRNPEVVEFVGGNEQTVTTSGGSPNICTFTIRGISGPRLYGVDYDWKLASSPPEPQEWKLPWGRVDMTAKPARPGPP
jgi:hypothetical protein